MPKPAQSRATDSPRGAFSGRSMTVWAVCRGRHIGALRLAFGGLATLGLAVALGVVAGAVPGVGTTVAALVLLGLGWSQSLLASSALLAGVDAGAARVPLQGATDALMSYGGAAAALLSGPVLAAAGYSGLSAACGLLLAPALAAGWLAHRALPRERAR